MENQDQRPKISFDFLEPTKEIIVLLDGRTVAILGFEKSAQLAKAHNSNRFGYLLEKEVGTDINLDSWMGCFGVFQSLVQKYHGKILAEEEKRAEETRRRNEELQQKHEAESVRLKERREQDTLEKQHMKSETTELAPLAKALKAQFAMRNNEDQMFEGVAFSLGLPIGTLVIDPERLDLLRLESVPFDQETSSDRTYRKRYFLKLLLIFDNCCANCGSRDNGIHLDHFMVPRSKGGTFIIYTKTGLAIHNAIPLCEPCNIQKSKNDFRTFFQAEILQNIFKKLTKLPDASEFDLNNAS